MFLDISVIGNIDVQLVERHLDYNQLILSISSLTIFLLLLTTKVFYRSFYKNLFFLQFKFDHSGKVFFDKNSSVSQANSIITIAATLSVAAATFSLISYSFRDSVKLTNNSIANFFAILGFVISYLFLKWLALKAFGWIFDFDKHINVYISSIFNNFRVLGIILFPFFLMAPFISIESTKVLGYSILILAIIGFLMKTFKFFSYSIKIKFFNHYAILYFCVFEILPILLLIKIFETN